MISAHLVSRRLRALGPAVSDEDQATPPQRTPPADDQNIPMMRHLYQPLAKRMTTIPAKAMATASMDRMAMAHTEAAKIAICQSCET